MIKQKKNIVDVQFKLLENKIVEKNQNNVFFLFWLKPIRFLLLLTKLTKIPSWEMYQIHLLTKGPEVKFSNIANSVTRCLIHFIQLLLFF